MAYGLVVGVQDLNQALTRVDHRYPKYTLYTLEGDGVIDDGDEYYDLQDVLADMDNYTEQGIRNMMEKTMVQLSDIHLPIDTALSIAIDHLGGPCVTTEWDIKCTKCFVRSVHEVQMIGSVVHLKSNIIDMQDTLKSIFARMGLNTEPDWRPVGRLQ